MSVRHRLLAFGGLYAVAALSARPALARWGSTSAERAGPLPGDDLVPGAAERTHAITIAAPAAAVWPWLVQMGQDRAGFYSHDRLERLVGAGIVNAEEIHPEWQSLAVGDLVRTYRRLPRLEPLGWVVARVEPPSSLVLHEAERRGVVNSSWTLALDPLPGGRSRLVSRWRFRRRGPAHELFKLLILDPAHFVMETGVLRGVRERAERGRRLRAEPAAPVEARA